MSSALSDRSTGAGHSVQIIPRIGSPSVTRIHPVTSRFVIWIIRRHRSHNGKLIHNPCHARQQFTDLNAGNTGRDRTEDTSNLRRRIGPRVERLVLRRPSRHVQPDQILYIARLRAMSSLRCPQRRQTGPALDSRQADELARRRKRQSELTLCNVAARPASGSL